MPDTKKPPRIVVIGGGTGTYSVLTGLRAYFDDITAVVSMADTGGSARKERDEFGLLPSSDVRKSLVGLADTTSEQENLLRELFGYRYDAGKGVSGMTFGNLFLVALTKLLGSQTKAIAEAGKILRIKGRVLPVSLDKVDLVAEYENGMTLVGEHNIDEPQHNGTLKITKLTTKPRARIYPPVAQAIAEADLIVLGPGGFYTTLLANIIVTGMAKAIRSTHADVVYIMNLMTEYGQTAGFTAADHLNTLEQYIGANVINYVLINQVPIPPTALRQYARTKAQPVRDDLDGNAQYQVVRADLLSPRIVKRQSGDTLKRSLVRHDPNKLAHAIAQLI